MQASMVKCQASLGSGARPASKVAPAAVRPAIKGLPWKVAGFTSLLSAGSSWAFEPEAPELSLPSLPSLPEVSLPQVSLPAIPDDVASLFADNPFLIGGSIALVLIPLGIVALLGGDDSKKVKLTTAAKALEALGEDPKVILLDIRSKAEVKEQGSPDLKSVKRKSVQLPYSKVVKGEVVVDETFGEKFSKLGGLDDETRLVVLDSAGGNEAVAAARQILEAGAVKSVYVVQGGTEGPKGWRESGAPWKEPSRGLELPTIDLSKLDFSKLDPKNIAATIDTLTEDFKAAPTVTKGALTAGAVAGLAFLLVNEINLVLEVVGLVAAGQFAVKLMFAEDREKTFTEIKTLVNDKIAVGEAGEDLKKLATVLLEDIPAEGAVPAAAVAAAVAAEPKPAAAAAEKAGEAKAAEPVPAAPAAPAAEPVLASSNGNGAAKAEVPENVKEARDWIGAWKAKSQ